MEDTKWKYFIVNKLDFALQPIVSIHTGACYGYEALLRGHDRAGFASIPELFNRAHEEEMLLRLHVWLKEMAIAKLCRIDGHQGSKLFFNLDNRVLSLPEYSVDATTTTLSEYGLRPDSMCFEISERHEFISFTTRNSVFDHFKRHAYKVAIDDFGTGFSGLQLLYQAEPDFIKIDRFFIASIETDPKKKLFVSNVVSLAHTLGITVIAEGVETEREYYACKEIGCDLVQGFLVQAPTTEVGELRMEYEEVAYLNSLDGRGKVPDRRLIGSRLEQVPPICLYSGPGGGFTEMSSIFDAFRRNKANTFFPVVNTHGEPIGLVREQEIKDYVYSKYGKDLLMNKAFGKTLKDFVVKCPIMDISMKIEKMIEAYATEENPQGVIVTENGRYIGFLTTQSLLNAINEKNLRTARDQNPLTKLPGNTTINEYVDRMFADRECGYVLAYFDFDNFKAFNDKYGFRIGDRAILLFADILKKASSTQRFFVGHIGGDDFFAGFKGKEADLDYAGRTTRSIVRKFRQDAVSLYDAEDRQRGLIVTTDRDGNERTFPLLSCSAVVLSLPAGERTPSLDELGRLLARLKKESKVSQDKIVFFSASGTQPERTSPMFPSSAVQECAT